MVCKTETGCKMRIEQSCLLKGSCCCDNAVGDCRGNLLLVTADGVVGLPEVLRCRDQARAETSCS